jgi:hypothetical protein
MSKVKMIDIIWEYTVKEEYLDQFLRIYSPDGKWATLFREYPGFIKTDLKQDISDQFRFITIDSWVSFSSFSEMKERGKKEYEYLDKICESFTIEEKHIGTFENINKI